MKLTFISYGFRYKDSTLEIAVARWHSSPWNPGSGSLIQIMKPYEDVWRVLAVFDRLEFHASNSSQYSTCSRGTY